MCSKILTTDCLVITLRSAMEMFQQKNEDSNFVVVAI